MRIFGFLLTAMLLHHMTQAQSMAGDWQGTLSFSGVQLRLVFHIQEAGEGYTATMDSPDQGANGIPVQSVAADGSKLTMKIPALGVLYEGELSTDRASIKGVFRQGGVDIPLELALTTESIPAPKRPQEPKPPFPYREEMVTFQNPKATEVTLAGTLSLPEGDGPFPAVILISGSGPQNRDEELLGHKPFLVIADHFTRAGIAVLRFDDRGVGASTGNFQTATSEDFASDVAAGLGFLKDRKEINTKKIGLAGHSEGGLIAPMVAADHPEVGFIILMAGPGVNGEEVLLLQQQLIAKAEGAAAPEIEKTLNANRVVFQKLRNSKDSEATRKELIEYTRSQLEELPEEEKVKLGDLDQLAEQQIRSISTPWFRFFLTYEPASSLERVRCPVLAVNGGKDLQVDAEQNIPLIAKALKKGGNKKVTTKVFPGLNHLFQHSESGKVSEYAQLEETFAPEVLAFMTQWIKSLP